MYFPLFPTVYDRTQQIGCSHRLSTFYICDDSWTGKSPSSHVQVISILQNSYVFNNNNEKVYLVDEDGFNIAPEDAVNMSPSKEEDGFFVGGATDGEKVPNISWDDIEKNS